ncbi:MAG: hypothetical protein KAW17_01735 [Candidatus Eisenbacteria sp.]|nr:hypothetical protein [Candidatus Eisenbacteria bacterium]
MNSTQIVLLVVGVLLLGLAAFVGITQFGGDRSVANEEALSWDASLIVAAAERWYKESGTQSFEGLTIEMLNAKPSNDNGTFEFQNVTEKGFQLIATGVEDGDGDGDPLQIRLTYNAFADSTTWEKLND